MGRSIGTSNWAWARQYKLKQAKKESKKETLVEEKETIIEENESKEEKIETKIEEPPKSVSSVLRKLLPAKVE